MNEINDLCSISSFENNNIFDNIKDNKNKFKKEIEIKSIKNDKINNYNCNIKKFQMNENIFKNQLYNESKNLKKINPEYLINPNKTEKFIEGKKEKNEIKLNKRNIDNNPSNENFKGPWASFKQDNLKIEESKLDINIEKCLELKKEKEDIYIQNKTNKNSAKPDFDPDSELLEFNDVNDKFTSFHKFYIKEKYDYKGKSFLEKDIDLLKNKNRKKVILPEKLNKKYIGHDNSVSVIKFFPKYGHYFLSGSYDNTIKLWETYNHKKLILNMEGHSKGIKDINFNYNGKNFLSCSFDNRVNYWDLEKGIVIRTFNTLKYPYCVKFNPEEDKQHLFLLGSTNSNIIQYDLRNGEKVLEYKDHSSSINSINFCCNDKNFVSTSDDKKIYLWEFGSNAVIKQINDPNIQINYSINHIDKKHILCQTNDNKIIVIDVSNYGLKLCKNKIFTGHSTSGYSIGISISYDGNNICSGDHQGNIYFWDWNSCKLIKTLKSFNNICSDVEFSPNDKNGLLSCSWDNTIKLWGN